MSRTLLFAFVVVVVVSLVVVVLLVVVGPFERTILNSEVVLQACFEYRKWTLAITVKNHDRWPAAGQ